MRKFARFVKEFYTVYLPTAPKGLRHGQSLMNFLYKFDEEEYKRIASINYYDRTDIDCFYVDELIGNTLVHLLDVWRKEE